MEIMIQEVVVDKLRPNVYLRIIVDVNEHVQLKRIESFSLASNTTYTFVPLRHLSKPKQRIYELERENAKLKEQIDKYEKKYGSLTER